MDTQESMLTTEDVANYLKVDVVTVRRLVSRGELAAYRVGAEFRFTLSDLQAYLKRQYLPVGVLESQPADKRFGPYFLLREIYNSMAAGRSRATPAIGERFTERARAALEHAQAAAEQKLCGRIYSSHLLLGVAEEQGGLGSRALGELGVTSENIRAVLAAHPLLTGPALEGSNSLGVDPDVKRALEAAVAQAKTLSHDFVGTEHVLLGLLKNEQNKATGVLRELDVQPEAVRAKVHELIKNAGS